VCPCLRGGVAASTWLLDIQLPGPQAVDELGGGLGGGTVGLDQQVLVQVAQRRAAARAQLGVGGRVSGRGRALQGELRHVLQAVGDVATALCDRGEVLAASLVVPGHGAAGREGVRQGGTEGQRDREEGSRS